VPPTTPTATAQIPGSKSATARALLIAALAPGTTRLRAPLSSADTLAFAGGLRELGLDVTESPDLWTAMGDADGPTVEQATV
jgi:3-phosphoshikimate 1-carboxyvinyltransferase